MGSISTTSILVHSGVERLLTLDRFFILVWALFNTHVLMRVRRRLKPLSFACVVLLLGLTKTYQRHKVFHAVMHLAGATGTALLVYELLDEEQEEENTMKI